MWLKEFPSQNIFLIDSDIFKQTPYIYLNKLQTFFQLSHLIDYKKILVFDTKKSFYCLKHSNNTKIKCLGKGKGRKYASMDEKSLNYLNSYYHEPNKKLKDLLKRNSYELPNWLSI